jgi:hypothetical protein
MKILYLLKQDPEPTLKAIMDSHKKTEDVHIIDLRENTDFDKVVDQIASSDKVISV